MLFETLVRNPRIKPDMLFEVKHMIAVVYNLLCSDLRSDLKKITEEDEIHIIGVRRIYSTEIKTNLYFSFEIRGLIFIITTEVKTINKVIRKDCCLGIADGEGSPGEGRSKHKKTSII